MKIRYVILIVATTWALLWIALCGVAAKNTEQLDVLKQQLDDANKLMESCYEDAQQFRDDWFACQRQKGFEWKEDMELICSHFKEEEE